MAKPTTPPAPAALTLALLAQLAAPIERLAEALPELLETIGDMKAELAAMREAREETDLARRTWAADQRWALERLRSAGG